ncbi:unnamed protein product [Effrenium voratum]|uniref:Conjugal transfer protein TraG n=1 Tax=Effrenium voratum TaxID=2562239 RepID=A0AA36IPW9_9DINO|nr:unnamed protein product [Effrenium voratum]
MTDIVNPFERLAGRLSEFINRPDHRVILPVTAVATAVFLNVTDGLFMERAITWRNEVFADTTAMRVGWVALCGAIGFGIGWFFSGKHKALRSMLLGLVLGVVGFLLLFDHGAMGWGSSTFLSVAAFIVGLGYWISGAASGLADRLSRTPTTFGDSKWADYAELYAADLIGGDGFLVGCVRDESGEWQTIHYEGERHIATIAPNRSGKGTTSIIPNLLIRDSSVVVIDPKGENAMITAEHRQEVLGQDVYVVDPWAITGLSTACFNPIDWLVAGDIELSDNAMLLADAIIMTMGENEQFWTEEAKALLLGIMLYVATAPQEEGQRHLGRVRDLLLLDGDDLRKLFMAMLKSPHHAVQSTGARCLQKDDKLLSNVMASVQAQTHFLDSPRLRENLSRSDFRFEDLKAGKMTIYLVLPADKLNSHGRWLRLLIQQALTVNARNIEVQPDKPVLFILDELPALGKLTMVEQAFGLMAGFGMQLQAVSQDASQLKRIYGEGWESFIANAGVIQYFGSRDRFTAEYFSKLCGVTTVWDWSTALGRSVGITSGSNGGTNKGTSDTDTVAAKQRQLAYPDQLMRMPKDKQLILIENMNPIMAAKRSWRATPELKDLGVNLRADNGDRLSGDSGQSLEDGTTA